MTYLGSPPASQAFAPGTDTFNGDGTTVAFTLSRNVSTVNDIQVVVNNVVQQPTAYSVATSTLTFTAAPSSGTANIYVRYLSTNLVTVAPQQGTVYPSSLSVQNALYWDTLGGVGIGTTSPIAKLSVSGTQGIVTLASTTGTNYTAYYATNTGGGFWSGLESSTGGSIFSGTSAYSAVIGHAGAYPLSFATNNTERARIDASGNLLVGGAGQVWDERELIRSDTNTVKLGIYGNATSFTSSIIRAQVETAAGAGWYFFEGRSSGGAFQYGIRGNGTVATSDERRKKNIEPARSYLDDICKIPVVKYNWKTDEDIAPKELGWIAQDVEKVFPNMVVTHHDGPDDDQEVLLLKKEVFVPMLMKCIQEQQALITDLQTRLAALEAK